MHPPRRFDFSWADWCFALRACLAPPPWAQACEQLQRRWSDRGDALAFLSARSAFDLFLRVAGANWRRGDEIVFTALTIPDMPAIARRHGFRPVALDIHPLTTAWDADALAARKRMPLGRNPRACANAAGSTNSSPPGFGFTYDEDTSAARTVGRGFSVWSGRGCATSGGTTHRAKLRMRPTDEPSILTAEQELRRTAGTAAK